MADSTVSLSIADVSKLKVVELKRELKNRGLSATGDKAELTARLIEALQALQPDKDIQEEDTLDDTDDDDDLDEDAVLHDDDYDETIIDQTEPDHDHDTDITNTLPDTIITTKRKHTVSSSEDVSHKKIILNRTPSLTPPQESSPAATPSAPEPATEESKVKTKINKIVLDPQSRLEMRAKRFGLPPAGDTIKEARKARFGSNGDKIGDVPAKPDSAAVTTTTAANVDVLKKRAERFGLNVSKTMVDIEQKEKLEKRKAKFGLLNA